MLALRRWIGMPNSMCALILARLRPALLLMLVATSLLGCHGSGSSPPDNPVPTLATLAPTSASAGTAFTLTVNGSGFVSSSVVNWNGTALTTTFVSSTQLTASVPANVIGTVSTVQITVTNPTPGGGNSAQLAFAVVNPTPVVASLSQTSSPVAGAGFTLTVTGNKFVAGAVVRWNGSDRATSFGSATQLTVTIPESDLVFAGTAQVTVVNPTPGGGSSAATSFTIQPRIANGISLTAPTASSAIEATTELDDLDASGSDIVNGVVMNRLDIRVSASATVGQVNDALASVGAGIVSMSAGLASITIGVPMQSTVAALTAIAARLKASPGIDIALVAYAPQPLSIFPGGSVTFTDMAAQVRHLLPARFPAAWNAVPADLFGDPANPVQGSLCPFESLPVLVADYFSEPPDPSFTGLFPTFQGPAAPLPGLPANVLAHGYIVSETLGANGLGANPYPLTSLCLDLRLVQIYEHGSTPFEVNRNIVAHMPASGMFVVNYSIGGRESCIDTNGASAPCQPPNGGLEPPISRAVDALDWKDRTQARWSDFLMVAAAGNARAEESAIIYPGMGQAAFESGMTISQFADGQFQFLSNDALWTPAPAFAAVGFTSLKPTAADQALITDIANRSGLAGVVADNVVVVGSATGQTTPSTLTQHVTGDQLVESFFSNSGPDVLAVGENVLDNPAFEGTSVAAPQVAGLASLLWMLSPDLRAEPASTTKRAIVANARNRVIDAYASVLSLDQAAPPDSSTAGIRNLILDLNRDTAFTDADIDTYLRQLFVVDNTGAITHQAAAGTSADFSRFDLNGDGFTTAGARRERFDLDRVGSTQFGATRYSVVSQNIEGSPISFDETALTDLEILCYYAYSPLYRGDPNVRSALLDGHCGFTVQPTNATVRVGGQQQFGTTLPAGRAVSWSTSCGSIDANGLFTGGSSAGQCTVRAVDVSDPSAFSTATVTVSSGGGFSGTLQIAYSAVPIPNPNNPDNIDIDTVQLDLSVFVDVDAQVNSFGGSLASVNVITVRGSASISDSMPYRFACYANSDPQNDPQETRTVTLSGSSDITLDAGSTFLRSQLILTGTFQRQSQYTQDLGCLVVTESSSGPYSSDGDPRMRLAGTPVFDQSGKQLLRIEFATSESFDDVNSGRHITRIVTGMLL